MSNDGRLLAPGTANVTEDVTYSGAVTVDGGAGGTFTSSGTTTLSGAVTVSGAAAFSDVSSVTFAGQSAAPSAVAGDLVAYATAAGQLASVNPQGLVVSQAGAFAVVTTAVPVANTTSETIFQQASVPAGDPAAGAVYRMRGCGVYSDTATPTLAIGARWGGVSGTSLAAVAATTLGSSVSNEFFDYDLLLVFITATTVQPSLVVRLGTSTSTNATTVLTAGAAAPVTVVSGTSAHVLCTTVTWSAASASNTISLLGGVTERLA